MPFITCRVVDLDGVGCPGMRVLMRCHRLRHHPKGPIRELSAYTEADGTVQRWDACDEPTRPSERIDAREYSLLCATFLVGTYTGQHATPWVAVQAQLIPDGSQQHLITLHIGPTGAIYSVKYTKSEPDPGSDDDVPKSSIEHRFEAIPPPSYPGPPTTPVVQPRDPQGPLSSLALPPLINPISEPYRSADLPAATATSDSGCRKRKVRFEDEAEVEREHPRKKRRLA
ncbi:uncharacterized protein PG986_014479 [Apiospora aurea]|uniref:Uncharacterized protein n=1 Tax=Apiospora aurea TaxID=335848 RepID=A0ABR1PT35_9PEZI